MPPSPGLRSAASASATRARARRTPPLGVPARACGCAAARRPSSWTSAPGPPTTPTSDGRDALRRRPASHLPPRPRRALRRVRLGAHRPRAAQPARPPARYPIGGWGALVDRLERRVAGLGVERSRPASAVTALPARRRRSSPSTWRDARALLGDDSLRWPERPHALPRPRPASPPRRPVRSSPTSTRPAGSSASPPPTRRSRPTREELVQAQMPIRPEESAEQATPAPRALCSTSPWSSGARGRRGGGAR